MSEITILGVVAMVCVSVALPTILAMYLGRKLHTRASQDGFEVSTSPTEPKSPKK